MQDNISQSKKELSKKIRRAAMNMLARREHSSFELAEKLNKKFQDKDIILSEISKLTSENLQSDFRYAEAYIRSRSGKGYGRFRIEMELQQKRIPEEIIQSAMDSVDVDWDLLIARQYQKKFKGIPPVDATEKAKYIRYFTYRGFSQKACEAVIYSSS